MINKKLSSAALTFILPGSWLALLALQLHAQQASQGTIIVNTDLVTTWAQVTNHIDGSPVKGLGINDFQLREVGIKQQVSLVKEGQPLSVMILVDGMTCVRPLEIEFQRSREALHHLGQDAEIGLMAWDSDVRLVQPLTRNQHVIANHLEDRVSFFTALNGIQNDAQIKVRPERDHARPGEAIYQAAQYLEKAASPERRKIIIVITQSFLLMSKSHLHAESEVKDLLFKQGITVYALLENNGIKGSYGSELWDPSSWIRVRSDNRKRKSGGILEEFVSYTGGATLVSENEAWLNLNSLTPNVEFGKEYDGLLIKLTRLIRSSYTIGYYPENTNFDGKFRRIKLELSPSGKAKAGKVNITTREGYYAVRRPTQ